MRDENGDTPEEALRRQMIPMINATTPQTREEAEALYGQVWDTDELRRDFNVRGFMAPFVAVCRKSDDATGVLCFTNHPRWYFGWVPD